jgi:uncharacterized GH25 family protein
MFVGTQTSAGIFFKSFIYQWSMKKYKKIILSIMLLAFLQSGLAHEFWLMPARFRVKAGEKVNVKLLVGENFRGEDWGKKRERTLQVTHWGGKAKTDLTAQATQSDANDLMVEFKSPGTHLVAMQSKNSFIELEGDKFDAYLKEDGIDNILALRTKNGQANQKARELYQRCAKTLVQVGGKDDNTYQLVTGMPLEIVPLDNPYQLKAGDRLRVRVLFEGKPLADHSVRTWHKTGQPEGTTQTGQLRTDANGEAALVLSAKGFWMVSLVRMVPNPQTSQSDYQSYWGSLTFEL